MNLSTQVIKEYITRLNKRSSGVTPYKQGIAAARKLALGTITEQEVTDIIQPFLYDWGWMWRVLERIEYVGWQKALAEKARSNASTLEQFRAKELTSNDPTQHKSEITLCYDAFEKVVGPIAAAKILHLLCPSFLPPWDRKIAKAAKTERSSENSDSGKTEKLSANDYFQFTIQVRQFIRTHDTIISKLASLYGKSKVKIADECFWWATQRPLFVLMGNTPDVLPEGGSLTSQ